MLSKQASHGSKIQARTEESANFMNGLKLLQLAATMLTEEPKDKEAAKALAGMAKERFIKASESARVRGASFEAAIAANNAAAAVSIISDNLADELGMLDTTIERLREAAPKVESGEIEVNAFVSVVKGLDTHLYIHLQKRGEKLLDEKVVGLMLKCTDLLQPMMEQTENNIELIGLIGMRGILRAIALGDGKDKEDGLAEIHADALNSFKALVNKLEQKGGDEEKRLVGMLRSTIMPEFNQTFKLLRGSSGGGRDLKDVAKWLEKTDPNDPKNGIPIHG